ncbi:hypothetical protein SLS61_001927 [Didymella pomorum]
MIRAGRANGWLKQPIDTLPTWATFHGVSFNGIKIGPLPGFEDRGSTVIADRGLEGGKVEPLLAVPKELIISRQNIELFAKADRHLREVLEATGDFGRATICCPGMKDIGVLNPLTEYIKYLPDELLPTFWSEEEQELLTGTTLQPAYWWDEDTGLVNLDDWLCVDAMYRSRALEFPGVGDCMCPCVDMANHASGDATAALYETNEDGDGLLLLRPGKNIDKDGEITITYGDDKGACENIFSYGFLEDSMSSAKVMFLNIDIPDDDPLRPAKIFVSTAAPGFRLFEKNGAIDWESDFIWLVIVNEEDGLDFKVRQTVDGKREIQSLWKDAELDDTSKLREYLHEDPLWDVYQLRATVLLQGRVDAQIALLRKVGNPPRQATVRPYPWSLAERLRTLELNMLEKATDALEHQKSRLFGSTVVQQYLGLGEEDEEVDFT